MPKSGSVPSSLNLGPSKPNRPPDTAQQLSPSTLSPTSPRSPPSAQGSPYGDKPTVRQVARSDIGSEEERKSAEELSNPASPPITAIPQYPPSPKTSPKQHGREPSKSFFSNLMASKSSHRLQSPDRSGTRGPTQNSSRASSKERGMYSNSKARGSTPDLSRPPQRSERRNGVEADETFDRNGDHPLTASENYPAAAYDNAQNYGSTGRNRKPRFGGLLKRSQSIRADDNVNSKPSNQPPLNIDIANANSQGNHNYPEALKTAPLQAERDRAFKDVANSVNRNRSADRQPNPQSNDYLSASLRKENRSGSTMAISSSFKDGAGAQLLSNLQQTSKGAADRLGKAGKGFFGKITRSGSSNEREVIVDEKYTCRVITMPLVQQTRRTRIAKRLEESKDKTEFWMPALPWRCIDYLNMNGCEEEGLYRVPGSSKDVKLWQKRFDIELDINLFDEPDLHDINTIGSMFKTWLRDLPDEILPKSVQTKVAEQCMGATSTPQLLKDELSQLPPFNYYLLFAITCHLSLLNSFSAKNKMNYGNLCVCFQPCLKIDAFCFQFLVNDWKNCWQGCWTEKEYLEEEYRWQKQGAHFGTDAAAVEERAISSSDSGHQGSVSIPSTTTSSQQAPKSHRRMNGSRSTSQSKISMDQSRPQPAHQKSDSQLPELGPPLSPIKI